MIDTIFHYKGAEDCDSCCRLRIHNNVVIATEIESNQGTSITNWAETLATLAVQKSDLNPEKLIWIEHYLPDLVVSKDDAYSLVQFNWDGKSFSRPRWVAISRKAVEQLFGHPLE